MNNSDCDDIKLKRTLWLLSIPLTLLFMIGIGCLLLAISGHISLTTLVLCFALVIAWSLSTMYSMMVLKPWVIKG